jgi:hypothetical protein
LNAVTSNPYQSPSTAPDQPTVWQPASRPIGISILAGLHAVGGLLFGALFLFLITQFDQSGSVIGWVILVLGPPLTILALATAVGLWRGQKWAWWVATLYYFQFVIGGVFVLATIAFTCLILQAPMTERRQELFFQHIGRIPVFSLLTWYMMKRSVFAYFRFQRLTRLRALLILGGIVLVVGMLLGLPVLVALSRGTRLI